MISKTRIALLAGAIGVVVLTTIAQADITTRTEYACWDETLRVTHGGYVSYYHTAKKNCDRARRAYPRNYMYVKTRNY